MTFDDLSTGEGAEFARRVQKNARHWGKWARRQGLACFRLYDGDLPNFAFAIDVYGAWLCVQEYAPPPHIDSEKAAHRRREAARVLPTALGWNADRIVWKTRQRQRGAAQYQKQGVEGRFFVVAEGKARFWVNLHDYLDTGLFLDHRPMRLRLGEIAADRRFLNLFAYTGTATVHAALGGARHSVTVDLSRTYTGWAQRNFRLNGLDETRHSLVCADAMAWLAQCRDDFDLIFIDPPTFSNSKKLDGVFDVQRDHEALLRLALARLAPGGELYFSNNYRRFVLTADLPSTVEITDLTDATRPADFQRQPKIHRCWRFYRPPR